MHYSRQCFSFFFSVRERLPFSLKYLVTSTALNKKREFLKCLQQFQCNYLTRWKLVIMLCKEYKAFIFLKLFFYYKTLSLPEPLYIYIYLFIYLFIYLYMSTKKFH